MCTILSALFNTKACQIGRAEEAYLDVTQSSVEGDRHDCTLKRDPLAALEIERTCYRG